MNYRGRGQDDRHLATGFCDNARAFHVMAQGSRATQDGLANYYFAIAIELGLKAYLLHREIRDQWNRVHLRHDLTKALKSVRRAGLRNLPEGMDELCACLGPPYSSGALRHGELIGLPMSDTQAHVAVGALLTAVEAVVRNDGRAIP